MGTDGREELGQHSLHSGVKLGYFLPRDPLLNHSVIFGVVLCRTRIWAP